MRILQLIIYIFVVCSLFTKHYGLFGLATAVFIHTELYLQMKLAGGKDDNT